MRHLTDIASLADRDLFGILNGALDYDLKLTARQEIGAPLTGRLQFNLFYEDSTRTTLSFLVAARRMGAEAIHVPLESSSVRKGESLRDTVQTLCAQGADFIVVRAKEPGSIEGACSAVEDGRFETAIMNGGEGSLGHPTQGLLDAATLLKTFRRRAEDGLSGVTVAIVGDLSHSRVAASTAPLLAKLGAEVRLCAPESLLPRWGASSAALITTSREEAVADADVVMTLRIQNERFGEGEALDKEAYRSAYGISMDTIRGAKPGAFVMHPGPMNRGVEIDNDVVEDANRSLVTKQVAMGVPTRMACLAYAAEL